jgi:hypothetical protein
VTRAATGEEPYFSAYLNRVYPVVRKVESDASVTAVKSWVDIVREHYDQQRVPARMATASSSSKAPPTGAYVATCECASGR